MKMTVFARVAPALLALSLAACGSDAEPAPAPADASPDAPAGISVTDGRMNIPAVAGNPAAVYFAIANGSDTEFTIRAVSVAGAQSASLHQTTEVDGQMQMSEMVQVPVPAHGSLSFEQGGMHVMAMGVPEGLEPGGEIEVTLSFTQGDKVSFPVQLLAPGDSGHAMHMGD